MADYAVRHFEDEDRGRTGVELMRYADPAIAQGRLAEYEKLAGSCTNFTFEMRAETLPATLATTEPYPLPGTDVRASCYLLSLVERESTGWFGVCLAVIDDVFVSTSSQSYQRSATEASALSRLVILKAIERLQR